MKKLRYKGKLLNVGITDARGVNYKDTTVHRELDRLGSDLVELGKIVFDQRPTTGEVINMSYTIQDNGTYLIYMLWQSHNAPTDWCELDIKVNSATVARKDVLKTTQHATLMRIMSLNKGDIVNMVSSLIAQGDPYSLCQIVRIG